jgi:hypothetical protein
MEAEQQITMDFEMDFEIVKIPKNKNQHTYEDYIERTNTHNIFEIEASTRFYVGVALD